MIAQPALTTTEECGVKVHIGSLIGNELRRQRRPAAWLAQEICCDRTNVYKILRKGSIDTELLCRISIALNHDFFADFQSACGFAKAAARMRDRGVAACVPYGVVRHMKSLLLILQISKESRLPVRLSGFSFGVCGVCGQHC